MASAVQLFPRRPFGPAIEHGFYHDFDPEQLTDKDLRKIEKEMAHRDRSPKIEKEVITDEARERPRSWGQGSRRGPRSHPEEEISFYYHDGEDRWGDCARDRTLSEHDSTKLQHVAGPTGAGTRRTRCPADLRHGLLKDALKEHPSGSRRSSGTTASSARTSTSSVHANAGAGFVFWHPNLGVVRANSSVTWDLHTAGGTSRCTRRRVPREPVRGPGTCRTTGDDVRAHGLDELPYRVKPMNCPGHA